MKTLKVLYVGFHEKFKLLTVFSFKALEIFREKEKKNVKNNNMILKNSTSFMYLRFISIFDSNCQTVSFVLVEGGLGEGLKPH